MTDEQLEEALRSLWKACFVKYYRYFADSSLSTDDIVHIMTMNGDTWTTQRGRISNARRIFRDCQQFEALHIIVGSKAVFEVRRQARLLLEESS